MGADRQFIGWDEPVLAAVTRRLLAGDGAGITDLSSTMVVVPSRQASRRLRAALAEACAEQDTGLLAPRVITPSWFTMGEGEPAPPVLVSAAWARILLPLDLTRFPHLFPSTPPERDLAWALETGNMLQQLRETLAEAGLRCGDVPGLAGAHLPEPRRWRELAVLEDRLLAMSVLSRSPGPGRL